MLNLSVKAAQSQFFNVKAINRRIASPMQKILSEHGRDVRQEDRKLIRPRRQMTLAEMSAEQRENHKRRQRIAKDEGKPAPKKPTKGSAPGEAPRRGKRDLLRRFTFYVYDDRTDSVVVGAAKLGGVKGQDAPENIQEGGRVQITWGENRGKSVYMEARPHITVAEKKFRSKLPGRFQNRF